ncbi:protein of unknown function [Streptantibioticus cattleyicolor NRRL 8057 = DSM 46488]|nr:protein of unknown function [Streptantibioticus cattleyicolor NRRL 8057 = DSM 46488]
MVVGGVGQLALAERTSSQWHGCGPWAHGLAALSWFLSTDGDTVLTCAQRAGDAAYDP